MPDLNDNPYLIDSGPTTLPGRRRAPSTDYDPDSALSLIAKYESGDQNIPNYRFDPGHTAQGHYQITNTNWRNYGPQVGVDLKRHPSAMAAPKEVQASVARLMYQNRGFADWAPFNPKLKAAIEKGERPDAAQQASQNPYLITPKQPSVPSDNPYLTTEDEPGPEPSTTAPTAGGRFGSGMVAPRRPGVSIGRTGIQAEQKSTTKASLKITGDEGEEIVDEPLAKVAPVQFTPASGLRSDTTPSKLLTTALNEEPALPAEQQLVADKFKAPSPMEQGARVKLPFAPHLNPTPDDVVNSYLKSLGPEYARYGELYKSQTGQNILKLGGGDIKREPDGSFFLRPSRGAIDFLNKYVESGGNIEAGVGDIDRQRGETVGAIEAAKAAAAPDVARLEAERVLAGRMSAGERAVNAPTQRFAGSIGSTLAGATKLLGKAVNLGGLTPNRLGESIKDFGGKMKTRATIVSEGATLPPLTAQGEEIQRQMPEKAVAAAGDLGFGIFEIVALKKITRLSMGQIMGAKSALQGNSAPRVAQDFAMGQMLENQMGRLMSGTIFSAPTGVQVAQSVAQAKAELDENPNDKKAQEKYATAVEDALIAIGVEGGIGSIMGGKKKADRSRLTEVQANETLGIDRAPTVPDFESEVARREQFDRLKASTEPEPAFWDVETAPGVYPPVVHHSNLQPRRARNTETGTRGQFKKGKVSPTELTPQEAIDFSRTPSPSESLAAQPSVKPDLSRANLEKAQAAVLDRYPKAGDAEPPRVEPIASTPSVREVKAGPAPEIVLSQALDPYGAETHPIARAILAAPKWRERVLSELGEGAEALENAGGGPTWRTANGEIVKISSAYGSDKEPTLGTRLDGIVIEREQGAAQPKPTEPQKIKTQGEEAKTPLPDQLNPRVTAPERVAKPPREMSPKELEETAQMVELLGEEGAKRYESLQRQRDSNFTSNAEADKTAEVKVVVPSKGAGVGPATPSGVGRVPVGELSLDPERFQYKTNRDARGSTGSLADVQKWNDQFAGLIQVWRDPADGKVYVVNGHNRYNKAVDTKTERVNVQYIDAATAKEARAAGAKSNIASGDGTAIDAAQYFRDSGESPETLRREGLPLNNDVAKNGIALSKLNDFVFNAVRRGEIPEGWGVAIGAKIKSPDLQSQAYKAITKAGEKRSLTKGVVDEILDQVSAAPRETQTEQTLFGNFDTEKSLFTERAQVAAAIKRNLSQDKSLFGTAARKSGRLAEGGTTVDVEQAKQLQESAAEALGVFDRLKNTKGSIAEILDKGAQDVASGKRPDQVAKETYAQIKNAVNEAIRGRVKPLDEGSLEASQQPSGAKGQGSLVEESPKVTKLQKFAADAELFRSQSTAPDLSALERGALERKAARLEAKGRGEELRRAGADPYELLDDIIIKGGELYRKAKTSYEEWAKKIRDEFGPESEPHLETVWAGLRGGPEASPTSSLKKASLAADRERLGLAEFTPAEHIAWEKSLDTAKAKGLDGDHADLVADRVLSGKQTVMDVDESAGILLRIRELENRHQKLTEQAWEETDPTRLAELRSEAKAIKDQFDKLSQASKQSKSDVARSLAFNRGAIDENYSLVGMQRGFKVDTGKEATGKNLAQIEQMNKEISRLTTELEKTTAEKEAALSAQAIKKLVRDEQFTARKQVRTRTRKALDDEAEVLKAQLAAVWKSRPSSGSGIQPIGLAKLDPEGIATKLVLKLAKNRVQAGYTTAEGLVDAVHVMIADTVDLTKREVSEMISGYGKTIEMSKDEVDVKLRELKSIIASNLGKADVIEKGIRPLRRGLQRDKPTQEVRQAARELRDALREHGIEIERTPRSPEEQQKSLLDAAKTSTRNRIEDLQQWIKDGKRTIANKTEIIPDTELQALRAERDHLTEVFKALDDPHADQQKIDNALKAIEKSIGDLETRIKLGDIVPKLRQVSTPWSPEISAAREAQKAQRGILSDLRAASKQGFTLSEWLQRKTNKTTPIPNSAADFEAKARQLLSAEKAFRKRAQEQIADIEKRIKAGDYSDKPKRAQRKLSPEEQKLKDKLEAEKNRYQNLKRRNSPGAWWANASGMRKAWLLSWIKTHIRNIGGTGLYQPFDEIARLPAVIVDAALSPVTGQRGISGPSPVAAIDSILYAARVGTRKAGEILKHGATREDMEMHQYQEINTGIKVIDTAHNAVLRFMSASDRVFREGAYRRNLLDRAYIEAKNEARNDPKVNVKQRAKELSDNPTPELDAAATHDALVATFNNSNALSDAIKRARSRFDPKTNFAIDLVMPFDRTPTNVVARILEASPVGFVKAATGGYKKSPYKLAKEIVTKAMTVEEQRQFSQTVGRATTGTALIGLGWALAPKLLSTDDKGNVFLDIYGHKVNIGLLSPMGNLLAIGARMRSEHDAGTLTPWSTTKIAGRTLTDQPLLRASSQVTEAVRDPERSAGRFAASQAYSFVPFSGAVRGVGELMDPAEKRYADQSFGEQLQRNFPVWRESLPLDAGRLFTKPNFIGAELERLGFKQGEVYKPTGIPEYDDRARQLLAKRLESIAEPRSHNLGYKNATDARKRWILREDLRQIRADVIEQVEGEMPEAARKLKLMRQSKIDRGLGIPPDSGGSSNPRQRPSALERPARP